MKKLGEFKWKAWYDKKTGRAIAYNSQIGCVNCPIRKKHGEAIESCPAGVTALPVVDLDMQLPPLIGKTKDQIEVYMEAKVYEVGQSK